MNTNALHISAAPMPSSPFTEGWFAALVLGLLAIGLITISSLPTKNIKLLFIKSDGRKSLFDKNNQNSLWSLILQFFFCWGVLTLLLYTQAKPTDTPFHFIPFLHTGGLLLVFFLAKLLALKIVGSVFFTPLQQNIYLTYQHHLLLITCSLLLPAILLQLYLPESFGFIGTLSIIFALFIGLILLVIEIFTLFFRNLVAGFYILLYLCTLEILPYFGLFLWIGNEVWKV